jgi:hypothetical protein
VLRHVFDTSYLLKECGRTTLMLVDASAVIVHSAKAEPRLVESLIGCLLMEHNSTTRVHVHTLAMMSVHSAETVLRLGESFTEKER